MKMSDSFIVKTFGELIGSCASGRRVRGNRLSPKKPVKSCVPDVIKKLRRHPDYQDIISLENQLRDEAEDLVNPDRIMSRFFSTMTYDRVHEIIKEQENDHTSELLTTYDRSARNIRSMHRVEDVAKFQVKLLLRYVDKQMASPKFIGKIASALQMEYGPLHASLLINNELLLEWNSSSLVVPKFVDPDMVSENTGPVLISATVSDHKQMRCQLSKPFEAYNEVELIFDAASEKIELLHNLARVIARYNSLYFYDVIFRNCQNFVLDALEAIGCKNKPQFDGNLKDYFSHLKKEGRVRANFETHDQLNAYVTEHHAQLTQENMEYLLAQYFLFHMGNVLRSGDLQDWNCKDQDCMMEYLEAKIDEKLMIMNRYLRPVADTHYQTTHVV